MKASWTKDSKGVVVLTIPLFGGTHLFLHCHQVAEIQGLSRFATSQKFLLFLLFIISFINSTKFWRAEDPKINFFKFFKRQIIKGLQDAEIQELFQNGTIKKTP